MWSYLFADAIIVISFTIISIVFTAFVENIWNWFCVKIITPLPTLKNRQAALFLLSNDINDLYNMFSYIKTLERQLKLRRLLTFLQFVCFLISSERKLYKFPLVVNGLLAMSLLCKVCVLVELLHRAVKLSINDSKDCYNAHVK